MIALVTLAGAEPGLQTVLLGTARVASYLGLVLLVVFATCAALFTVFGIRRTANT